MENGMQWKMKHKKSEFIIFLIIIIRSCNNHTIVDTDRLNPSKLLSLLHSSQSRSVLHFFIIITPMISHSVPLADHIQKHIPSQNTDHSKIAHHATTSPSRRRSTRWSPSHYARLQLHRSPSHNDNLGGPVMGVKRLIPKWLIKWSI